MNALGSTIKGMNQILYVGNLITYIQQIKVPENALINEPFYNKMWYLNVLGWFCNYLMNLYS